MEFNELRPREVPRVDDFLNGDLNLVRLGHPEFLLVLRKPLLFGYCIVMWILFGALSIFSFTKKQPPFFTPGSADTQQDGKTLVWQGYYLHVLS